MAWDDTKTDAVDVLHAADYNEIVSQVKSKNAASKTASDLTLYVYEDATGDANGSSKANAYTTLQAAIDAIPDVAQNVTVIVCKGSTNYLGQTTTIQKASVKSLTIQGEYYWYANCDANASTAGRIVDADIDTTGMAVGDRVVCMHYSGTVGSSSIDDYFYATITEIGEGYIQTSEGTKVPTTGWRYLINQTVFDGDNINKRQIDFCNTPFRFMGISCYNIDNLATYASETTGIIQECIFYSVKGSSVTNTHAALNFCAFINCNSISTYLGIVGSWYGATVSISDCIIDAASNTIIGVGQYVGATINLYYSGIFGCNRAIYGDTSSGLVYVKQTHIDSSCTYGAYGYNITLTNCTNNAATPVYNLTSGGSIEEWDGQALPSIDDATGGQVLALKSDKSGIEFASKQPLDATLTALAGVTTAAGKYPYFSGVDTAGVLDLPSGYNYIINPCFDVDQQAVGTYTAASSPANSDDTYLMDQWILLSDGNDIVDVSLDTSGAFAGCRCSLKAEVETANKKFGFLQIFESVNSIPFRNQVISVSFKAKTATSKILNNVRCAVLEWTGTADAVTSDCVDAWGNQGTNPTYVTSWAALNTPANLALTTSEQTFKIENVTVGASCNNLGLFVWCDDTDAAVDDLLYLSAVKFEMGPVATPFVVPRFDEELSKCQRFYQKSYKYSVAPGSASYDGTITLAFHGDANGYGDVNTLLMAQMRTTPTVTTYSPVDGTSGVVSMAVGSAAPTDIAPTIRGSEQSFEVYMSGFSAGSIGHFLFHYTANARL